MMSRSRAETTEIPIPVAMYVSVKVVYFISTPETKLPAMKMGRFLIIFASQFFGTYIIIITVSFHYVLNFRHKFSCHKKGCTL